MADPAPHRALTRAVIVDDEPLSRDCVRLALSGAADIEIVAECADGPAAVTAIRELGPDLVFLDVQMPGMTGLDVVSAVGVEEMPPVIFVTAFDEHALRAFELHAIDYVLKPFEDSRLHGAVARAQRRLALERDGQLARRLAALLSDPDPAGQGTGPWLKRLNIPVKDRIRFVRVDEVDWFEAAHNYVRVYVGTERLLLRTTLGRLEEQLDPARFVRVHRSIIVNRESVREVEPYVGGDYIAFLRTGQKVRVSRRYRERLFESHR